MARTAVTARWAEHLTRVEYVTAHKAVRAVRGAPSVCEECGGNAEEWANVSDDYWNPDDYRALCRPCHRSADARRRHDEREDHTFTKVSNYKGCGICNQRYAKDRQQRLHADPVLHTALRKRQREAEARYRARVV